MCLYESIAASFTIIFLFFPNTRAMVKLTYKKKKSSLDSIDFISFIK